VAGTAQVATMRPVAYARRRGARAAATEDWTTTWVCVGFAEQLARTGDLLPITISGHALHVRRDDAGTLSAALNARPFGGCMSIPLQCSGGRKIRCPHTACAFSEDPDLVSPHTDDGERLVAQFVGSDPARLVPVRLERWGSLLFVNLSPGPVAPLRTALAPVDAALPAHGEHEAAILPSHELPLGAKAAGPALAEALAARAGAGVLRRDPVGRAAYPAAIPFTRLIPASAARRAELVCFVVAPRLVLVRRPDHVLAAVLRPIGPHGCSVVGAVLRGRARGDADPPGDRVVAWWHGALAALTDTAP
jgi:hypothetical protein